MIRRPIDVVRRGGVYASVVAIAAVCVVAILSVLFVVPALVWIITSCAAFFLGGLVGLATGYRALRAEQNKGGAYKGGACSSTEAIVNGLSDKAGLDKLKEKAPQVLVALMQREAQQLAAVRVSASGWEVFASLFRFTPAAPPSLISPGSERRSAKP